MSQTYSDRELVQRIKQNDSLAFNELVKKYQARALELAYSLVGNRQDAEDIAQEAFIRVYKGLGRFRETADFFTWFYQIVINLCRDHHRQNYRAGSELLHLGPYSKEETGPKHLSLENIETDILKKKDSNPAKVAVDHELGCKINEAIKNLPHQQKVVFSLKHLEGLSIKDISRIMKCAEGTVKAHLWRAVTSLQKVLEPYLTQ